MKLLRAATTAIIISLVITGARAQQPAKAKTDTVRHGSAWTLIFPLGQHKPADMDTLLYNYQRQAIPSMQSDAYLSTGNLGAPSHTLIYIDQQQPGAFFFDRNIDHWMQLGHKQKFYNVYVPMTLASYNFGGNRESNQDRLRATFAGNVNRRIGIGAHIDYLYSKGAYDYQAAKDYIYGLSGYYLGDRYEMQAFWDQNNMLNKENGGITNDLYITDPAELQGGVSKIEPKAIPTRLSTAHTRLHASQFYMNHAYKIGYWQEQKVNDTLTRQIYIPVVKFIYAFDWRQGRHKFINRDAAEARDFWRNTYFDETESNDRTSYSALANTLGVQMMEGFKPWVKFSLSAYLTYENRRYTQYRPDSLIGTSLSPLPEYYGSIKHKASQNLLWVGGRLEKTNGRHFTYSADARFGILADVAADMRLAGEAKARYRLLGDTVTVAASIGFRNEEPSYLLNHYVSNHFIWENNFGKTRVFNIGGKIISPRTNTSVEVDFRNVQNMIYFDTLSMPRQAGKSIHVFTARLNQNFRIGIWNWNNTLTFQTSSDKTLLPLPALSVYSNMFLDFRAFRVLHLQIGVDCDYYTRYTAYAYQPATTAFRLGDGTKVGNYAFCNAYVTAKLYRCRFFVLWSHVNQGWFGTNYFYMPGYPMNPRRLQFGLSVDFAN